MVFITVNGNWLYQKGYLILPSRGAENLSSYDNIYLGRKAEELGFIRGTLDGWCKTHYILQWVHHDPSYSWL